MKLLLASVASIFLNVPIFLFMPDIGLLSWLGFAMMIDLVTGIWKSVIRKEARTSTGFQRTVNKFIKYFGAIIVSFIIQNVVALNGSENAAVMDFLSGSLVVFLIYIELVSILENLIALDKEDMMTRYLLIPFHNLLTFQVKNMFNKQMSDPSDHIQ